MTNKDINRYFASACLEQEQKLDLKKKLKKKYPEFVSKENIIDNHDETFIEKDEPDIVVTKATQITGFKRGLVVSVCAALALVVGGGYILSIQNNSTAYLSGSQAETNGIVVSDVASSIAKLLSDVCYELNNSTDRTCFAALNGTFSYNGTESFEEYEFQSVVDYYKDHSFEDTSAVTEKAIYNSNGVNGKGITALIFAHLSKSDSKVYDLLKKSRFTINLSDLSVEVTLTDGSYAQRKSSSNAVLCGDDLAENVLQTADNVLSELKSKGLKINSYWITYIHGNDFLTFDNAVKEVEKLGGVDKYMDKIIEKYSYKNIMTSAGLKYMLFAKLIENGSYGFMSSCNFTFRFAIEDSSLSVKAVLCEYDPGTGGNDIFRSVYSKDEDTTFDDMISQVNEVKFNPDGKDLWKKFPYASGFRSLDDTRTLVTVNNTGISSQNIDNYNTSLEISYCVYNEEINTVSRTLGASGLYYDSTQIIIGDNAIGMYCVDNSGETYGLITYDFNLNTLGAFSFENIKKDPEYSFIDFSYISTLLSSDNEKAYVLIPCNYSGKGYEEYKVAEVRENGSYETISTISSEYGVEIYNLSFSEDEKHLIFYENEYTDDEIESGNSIQKCAYIDLESQAHNIKSVTIDEKMWYNGNFGSQYYFYDESNNMYMLDMDLYINSDSFESVFTNLTSEVLDVMPEYMTPMHLNIFPIYKNIFAVCTQFDFSHSDNSDSEIPEENLICFFKINDGKFKLCGSYNIGKNQSFGTLDFSYNQFENSIYFITSGGDFSSPQYNVVKLK